MLSLGWLAGEYKRLEALLALVFARASSGAVQSLTIDIPLATIKAQISGVAFDIGAPLPPECQVLTSELKVIDHLSGTGPMTACTAAVQGTGDTAGALLGGSAPFDVFTADGFFAGADEGNAYQTRGGQQLQMTLTSAGGTLANALTGHLSVRLFFVTQP